MSAEAYPLQWPVGGKRTDRPKRSRFDVTFAKARNELIREIRQMGGGYVVISTNVSLRRDGLPYAGQKEPEDTGVAIYFMRGEKQMVFACDRWDKVKDNFRAIQKTIEALRGIERWGSSEAMEQAFSGFEALPAPNGWKSDLGFKPDANPTLDDVKFKYRKLAKDFHPDNGGDPEKFQKINTAYQNAQEELRV